MYGKILGVAGRVLAKKFLSKKTKSEKSAFLKRRNVLGTKIHSAKDLVKTKNKIG